MGKPLFEITRSGHCVVDGTPAEYVDNDVEEPDADPHLPPGWVKLTLTRIVENPVWREDQTRIDRMLAAREQIVEAQIAEQTAGVEVSDEDAETMRAQIADLLDATQPVPESDAPPYVVEIYEYAIAPHNLGVLGSLDLDDWPGA